MRRISPDPTRHLELEAPLTPQAQYDLRAAVDEARQHGGGGGRFVGSDHIALALLRGSASNTLAHVLVELGVRDEVRRRIEEIMASESYQTGSNKVVDKTGKHIGFMWRGPDGTPFVGDADGNPIHVSGEKIEGE